MSIFLRARIFFSPMPKQNESRRNCIKQSALGHEHRKRNTFPGDVVDVLVIDEFEIAQKLKAGETTVEQKTGNGKAAAPAIERVERSHRRDQSNPSQAANKIDIYL